MRRRSILAAGLGGLGLAVLGRRAGAEAAPLRMGYSESASPYSSQGPDGRAKGLLVDAVDLVASRGGIAISHQAFPWARTQWMVERGELDGFCTVPTPERQAYALFTAAPLVILRYGIFHRTDDRRPAMVRSMADLPSFAQGNYLGHGWAKQNLAGQDIHWLADEDGVLRMVAMGRLDIYIAAELATMLKLREIGLADKIAFTPAPFLPTADFHLGLRRSHSDAERVVAAIDKAILEARQDGSLDRRIAAYR